MPSRHFDPEQARRYAEHRYDFNRKSLAGRVVLLPGGAGGLGAAIAALLVQDGAIQVVGYRANRGNALAFQQRVQDLYGGLVHLVEGDVADPEVRKRYIDAALAVKGELYGVVALTGDPARVKGGDLDGAALHASFTANFEAQVLLARAAAEELLRRDTHGSIVLFSSMQGVFPLLRFAGEVLGADVAATVRLEDVTGEGVRDVVAPSPAATSAAIASGAIYLWNGGATLTGLKAQDATLRVVASAAGDALESGPAGRVLVGDVSNDGIADVIGVATFADAGPATDAGALYVWRGGPTLTGTKAQDATLAVPFPTAGASVGSGGTR